MDIHVGTDEPENVSCSPLAYRRSTVTAVVLVAGLVLAGCAGKQNTGVKEGEGPPYAGFQVTDEQIAQAVEKWLAQDPAINEQTMQVSVAEGIVTLDGMQESFYAAERAEFLAETIRGVRSVINQVDVKPAVEMTDEEIEAAVREAFSISDVTESYEVGVAAADGVVTLRGNVESWLEKVHAQRLATNVRGVTAVVNEIDVRRNVQRPDGEIKEDVLAAIKWDALLRGGNIQVSVENGEVRLKGMVPSAAEKRLAVSDAWVTGVVDVDAADLHVDTSAPGAGVGVAVVKDEDVQAAVDDVLLQDPRVSSAQVRVSVRGGVVRLRGAVGSVLEKRAAEQDARNTTGVLYVKNLLKVRDRADRSDEKIEQVVERSLRLDPYVPQEKLEVDVDGGEVRLDGTVQSNFEKMRADVAAARVSGVVAVVNRLDVEKEGGPLVFDPYLGDFYAVSFSWFDGEPGTTAFSDEEIEERIRARLWWSPYVTAEKVRVAVESGIARLEGKVDSWDERQAAARAAFDAGAVQVINNLEI